MLALLLFYQFPRVEIPRVKGEKDGTCYAFGAAAVLEHHYKNMTGRLINLSEQQFIDCTKDSDKFGNHGYNGGYTENVNIFFNNLFIFFFANNLYTLQNKKFIKIDN